MKLLLKVDPLDAEDGYDRPARLCFDVDDEDQADLITLEVSDLLERLAPGCFAVGGRTVADDRDEPLAVDEDDD